MELHISIQKHHLVILAFLILVLGVMKVGAFGSGGPASVVGHSAEELVVDSSSIVDGSIQTADIGNSQVTGGKIASSTVTGANIASGTVTSTNIQDATITDADISPSAAITNTKVSMPTCTGTDKLTSHGSGLVCSTDIDTDTNSGGTITGGGSSPHIAVWTGGSSIDNGGGNSPQYTTCGGMNCLVVASNQ